MNILEKIKTNWKNILIIILALFYVGSCTSNCSNKNELRVSKQEISAQHDSIVFLTEYIDSLGFDLKLKDAIIEQKQQNVESLERTAKRNIVNVVKIDTAQLKK